MKCDSQNGFHSEGGTAAGSGIEIVQPSNVEYAGNGGTPILTSQSESEKQQNMQSWVARDVRTLMEIRSPSPTAWKLHFHLHIYPVGNTMLQKVFDMDIVKYHREKWENLNPNIQNAAITCIRKFFDEKTVNDIAIAHKKNPSEWWAGYHHGWGTGVRNLLREHVCADNCLPSGNWDDYYIEAVERALCLEQAEP